MTQPIDPVGRRPPSIPSVAPSQPIARREEDERREGEDRRGGRDGEGEQRRPGEESLVDADGHIDVRA